MRRWAWLGIVVACGGSANTQTWPFVDENGRECTRTCSDDSCGTDCDGEPAPSFECAPENGCFTIGEGPLHGDGPTVLGACDACCTPEGNGIAFEWTWLDCSPLVCEDDADCAAGGSQWHCNGGFCSE